MLLSLVVFPHTSVYVHDDDDDCPDCDGSGELYPGCSHCGRVRKPSATEWLGGIITDVVPSGSSILNGIYTFLGFGDSGPGSSIAGVSTCTYCGEEYGNMNSSDSGYHSYGYCTD